MTARALLDELRSKGVRLSVEDDRVAVDAPRGLLTDTIRQAIREYKAALLVLLSPPMPAAAAAQQPEPLTPSYPCVRCAGTDRWDDRGIWRCMMCWPPAAHRAQRQAPSAVLSPASPPDTTQAISRKPDEILPGNWKAEIDQILSRDRATWTAKEALEVERWENNDQASRWCRRKVENAHHNQQLRS